jgi:predicted transcriptional regulator
MSDTNQPKERIGGFLIRIGAITEAQRDEILNIQKSNPGKMFGEIAVELGFINKDSINQYLKSIK